MSNLPPQCINVELGERSYPVLIQDGALERATAILDPQTKAGRYFVVSDEQVWQLHSEKFCAGLGEDRCHPVPAILPPGEATKSWQQLGKLVDGLIDAGIERNDLVVALGGGVVGDLAGFAATIIKRGCGLIHVPTTLLAQVDSSIGGKNGINVIQGKNLLGAFYQPNAVLIDPACLDTLPARETRAGYAEVVKYGLIQDLEFFGWCERHGRSLLNGDAGARLFAIKSSVEIKAAIVSSDERETQGLRALLNLGHTFAHALEAETGFSDQLLHGEAVAIGLCLAFKFSVERGLCDEGAASRVEHHLDSVGLPTRPGDANVHASGASLVRHMRQDKKADGGRVPFILVRGIGEAFVDRTVELDEVAMFLDRLPLSRGSKFDCSRTEPLRVRRDGLLHSGTS